MHKQHLLLLLPKSTFCVHIIFVQTWSRGSTQAFSTRTFHFKSEPLSWLFPTLLFFYTCASSILDTPADPGLCLSQLLLTGQYCSHEGATLCSCVVTYCAIPICVPLPLLYFMWHTCWINSLPFRCNLFLSCSSSFSSIHQVTSKDHHTIIQNLQKSII